LKFKWEPLAAMISLLFLGVWVVYAPAFRHDLRPDAETLPFTLGSLKADLEAAPDPAANTTTYRILYRDGTASAVLTEADFTKVMGEKPFRTAVASSGNMLFGIAKVTTWGGFFWVFIGLTGQLLFFGRMFVQWLVAEKEKKAIIPPSFWWFSFFGGIMLFTYFAWRQDVIGVLGQAPGVVIYARNLRLIHKQRRREERAAASASPTSPTSPAQY